MSGTSADGVDVVITRVEGGGMYLSACVVHHQHRPFDPQLRRRIFALRQAGQVSLRELADLARQIAIAYAAAVNEALVYARLSSANIACIAAHGQTLFHEPPLTLQWIDPALLASETGCAVVSDFRRADCAAGGQGAPLVPLADYLLFCHPRRNRALLNLGGIANVTLLPAGAALEDVIAFDTGPANCLSDQVMRRRQPEGCGYDAGGALALTGRPCEPLVDAMLQTEYFRRGAPKSTDVPQMIAAYEAALGQMKPLTLEDELASACEIAARAVVEALDDPMGVVRPPVRWNQIDDLIVSGGGTHNAAIMGSLRRWLAAAGRGAICTSDELGVASASKEALAFALLGAMTLDGLPGNVPSVTGARRGVVLGSVTPRP